MSGSSTPNAPERRRFLLAAAGGLVAAIAGARGLRAQGPDPLAGQGAEGSLRDPSVVGRPLDPTRPGENDEAIKRIEQRLHCTCGCNLDVFTCRTTDFSCTYSPAMHREVLAMYNQGKTAQQILNAFVAEYGEKVLMAPEPVGFNLWGYLLPGAAITVGAVTLAFVIGRRERLKSLAVAATGSASGMRAPPGPAPTPEELDRLRRALDEVDA